MIIVQLYTNVTYINKDSMERRLRRTLEIISALCIVSVILMMVSLAGPNSSYVSGPLLQRADKSVKSQHSNLLNGKITAVKIRNGASLSQETSGSVVMAPFMQLSKPISRVTAPKHSFQWLYHNSVLVYSAHYEHSTSLIKIVGFKHRQNHVTDLGVRCVYPDNTSEPMKFLYNVSVITPRPGLLYNTFVWKCKWKSEQLPPHHIKLADRQGQILANMSVTYHTWADGPDKSRLLLLCVKPIVKNYSDAYQLQEFIEMSRLMGAGKVVLYPQSIHEPVIRPIMDKYQASGFVDVHEWKPPVAMEALHAFGQKSHNQHCLYTYKYRYQWAAFIDLDELLVSNSSLGLYEDMIQAALRSLSYDTWVGEFPHTVDIVKCVANKVSYVHSQCLLIISTWGRCFANFCP